MRLQNLFGPLVAYLCLLLLLSACGTSSATIPPVRATVSLDTVASPTSTESSFQPTPTPSASLEHINWSNFTYTFSCFTAHPVQVTLHNSQANQDGVHYTIQKPVFGDLTGDGQPEAVIIYHCEGGGTSPLLVFVYSGTEQQPTLLANLPSNGDKLATVISALIVHGILQLSGYGYSANVPLCCPDLLVTTTYQWNGSNFSAVLSNSIPRPPNS